MCLNKFLNRQSLTGFTLIELLVVIGILSSGVVAVQTAIQYGLKSATIVSDGIVAAHLAEEGLELIRNIRDGNWAERQAGGAVGTWEEINTGIGAEYFRLDYLLDNGASGRLYSELTSDCYSKQALNFDSAAGLYSYAGVLSPSKFRRVITVIDDGNPSPIYIDVGSQVCWSDNIGPHEITLTERLYDWRPAP